MNVHKFVICLLLLFGICDLIKCGPPQFELNLQFSNSYLPAAMQIIAYLTESMKYELRPQSVQPATTSTPRPTPSHRPGLFQPHSPPPHREFKALNRKSNNKSLGSIIRQYEPFLPPGIYEEDLELLGEGPKNLHRVVDQFDTKEAFEDFLTTFDDDVTNSNLLFQLTQLRQKKMPPTRAYVTLLSLYDMLNRETKRLGLNRFHGYSQQLLIDLQNISTGTSTYQLAYVLRKIQAQKETRDQMLEGKIKTLIEDLGKEESYINLALRYIPPLTFVA